MAEVTIRRCVLRVVRHGGWSWGPEPGTLVSAALGVLPGLLAAELERVVPDDADGEVSAPMRIDIRVGLAGLRALARAAHRGVEGGSPTVAASAHRQAPVDGIADSIRRAVAAGRVAERVARSTSSGQRAPPPSTPKDQPEAQAAAVLRLLLAWHARGGLEALLRGLPDDTIVAWHRAVLDAAVATCATPIAAAGVATAGQSPASAEGSATIDALIAEASALAVAALASAPPSPTDRLRLRLRAATELASLPGTPLAPSAAKPAIDARLPVPTGGLVPAAAVALRRPSAVRRVQPGTDVAIPSTLPFLLLGPLHRTGWLEVAEATLAAAGLEAALPALAVALATKVLAEPERGWRRLAAVGRAAATFAGAAELPPDAEVVELARTGATLMPGLDAVAQRSLLDGRRTDAPLLLCAAGSVRLLVEPEGAFLVAHAADVEAAAARAAEAGAPIFIPAEDADLGLLRVLDGAGVTFVTPAPPVRGERWQAVPGTRSPRLFTNGRAIGVAPADDAAARARDTWDELERRPLGGRPADPALDRCVALAAALALGTIAWELWRAREPTSPRLALERFADFEGTVRFEERQVRVRLPLGKRHRDLEAAGFLADVPRVPWLDYRSVVFSGG